MFPSFPIRSARSRIVQATVSAALAGTLTVTGCASSVPVAYQALPSAPLLHSVNDSEEPFQYHSAAADLRHYSALIIDPVTIYSGPDAQFGTVSQKDRQTVADYMQREFVNVLGERYRIVAAPEAGAIRLHLTLTGLETSKPALSTVSHLAPVGLVFNAANEAAGRNGSFFGSVSYAADLSDASTGELLRAYVTKQTADALDVTAGLGTLRAAETGVRIGARHLSDQLAQDGMSGAVVQTARAQTNP
jgi:hypothetical protein